MFRHDTICDKKQVKTIVTKCGLTLIRRNPVKRLTEHLLTGQDREYFVNDVQVEFWDVKDNQISIIYKENQI